MKHSLPERRDPHKMLELALKDGWFSLESLPVLGEGKFMVLTMSGLVRLARSHRAHHRIRPADGYGPDRTSVIAEASGNYLSAIAWRWPEQHEG